MNKALHSCGTCPNNSRDFNIFNSCGRLSGVKFQPHLPTPGLSTRADAGAASDVIGLQPMAIHLRQHIQGSLPLPRRAASANHRVEACAKQATEPSYASRSIPNNPELKHVHTYTSEKKHLRQHTRYTVYSMHERCQSLVRHEACELGLKYMRVP